MCRSLNILSVINVERSGGERMPIKIGKKSYKSLAHAARAVKQKRPDIKDPIAYVAETERIIEERRAAKAKRLKDFE